MRRSHLAILFAVVVPACVTVSLDANRSRDYPGTIEPVAFFIFQENTPARFPVLMRFYLLSEARQRHIPASVTIIRGIELDEGALLRNAAKTARGLIMLTPVGGTRTETGQMVQILYDVRAFRILSHPKALSGRVAIDGGSPATEPATSSRDGGAPGTDGGAPGSGETSPADSAKETKGDVVTIWRARVDAQGGLTEERMQQIASRVVRRLITDRVLPGTAEELPAEPLPPSLIEE